MSCKECQIRGIKVENALIPTDVMIVGESPGREEEIEGRPFVGPSGKLLDFAISEFLKLSRTQIAIANATQCQIPPEIKKVKSLLRKVIQPCRENLVVAIRQVQPKYIITLGEVALSQVMGKWMSIGSNRGRTLKSEEFNCIVLPTYHPSAILRNGGIQPTNIYWILFRKDMEFFGKVIAGQITNTEAEYLPYNGNTEFAGSGFIAVDVEWDDKGKLLVFSISDGKKTRYVLPEDFTYSTKKVLRNLFSTKPVVFANRPVDERILSRYGLEIYHPIKIDIFNIAKLLDDNLHINLENIAERFLGEGRIKDVAKEVGKKVWLLEKDRLIQYNCKDTEVTAKAFRVMMKELKKDPKLYNYWKNFTLKIEEMLAQISMQGFKIDRTKLQINKTEVEREIAKLELRLLSTVNPKIIEEHSSKGISFTRPDFVIDILFSKRGLGLRPTKYTPTGRPSLREEDLLEFSKHPWVADFLKWKKLHKLYSTFLVGLEKNMNEEGYIYPNTVLYATVTGRTACFNPNLQQIPNNLPMVEKVKELFEVPEGYVMGARDLSQSEIRVIGWIANEKQILKALKEKVDIHKKTASLLLNKPIEAITPEERQLAKAVNFGLIYGATAKTFQHYAKVNYEIDISYEDAVKFRTKFFEAYPAIPVYHNRCVEITKQYGYIRNVLGRIRRLPHIKSDDPAKVAEAERQAINFPIQSFSSEIALIGMYLFWKEIKDKKSVRLLWFIHDSIFFMAKEDKFDEYMKLLKECMEKGAPAYIYKHFGVKVGYPVESEGKYGKNWAELKPYEES